MKFKCKFCGNVMNVSALQFKSNHFCNDCFEERARIVSGDRKDLNTFSFMGESFSLSPSRKNENILKR